VCIHVKCGESNFTSSSRIQNPATVNNAEGFDSREGEITPLPIHAVSYPLLSVFFSLAKVFWALKRL
jgi:hypothetical protein